MKDSNQLAKFLNTFSFLHLINPITISTQISLDYTSYPTAKQIWMQNIKNSNNNQQASQLSKKSQQLMRVLQYMDECCWGNQGIRYHYWDNVVKRNRIKQQQKFGKDTIKGKKQKKLAKTKAVQLQIKKTNTKNMTTNLQNKQSINYSSSIHQQKQYPTKNNNTKSFHTTNNNHNHNINQKLNRDQNLDYSNYNKFPNILIKQTNTPDNININSYHKGKQPKTKIIQLNKIQYRKEVPKYSINIVNKDRQENRQDSVQICNVYDDKDKDWQIDIQIQKKRTNIAPIILSTYYKISDISNQNKKYKQNINNHQFYNYRQDNDKIKDNPVNQFYFHQKNCFRQADKIKRSKSNNNTHCDGNKYNRVCSRVQKISNNINIFPIPKTIVHQSYIYEQDSDYTNNYLNPNFKKPNKITIKQAEQNFNNVRPHHKRNNTTNLYHIHTNKQNNDELFRQQLHKSKQQKQLLIQFQQNYKKLYDKYNNLQEKFNPLSKQQNYQRGYLQQNQKYQTSSQNIDQNRLQKQYQKQLKKQQEKLKLLQALKLKQTKYLQQLQNLKKLQKQKTEQIQKIKQIEKMRKNQIELQAQKRKQYENMQRILQIKQNQKIKRIQIQRQTIEEQAMKNKYKNQKLREVSLLKKLKEEFSQICYQEPNQDQIRVQEQIRELQQRLSQIVSQNQTNRYTNNNNKPQQFYQQSNSQNAKVVKLNLTPSRSNLHKNMAIMSSRDAARSPNAHSRSPVQKKQKKMLYKKIQIASGKNR